MTEPVRLPVPGRVSQATHIEQSRAAAEVFAAMQAAQALPRDENDAVRRMREACSRRAFADRAFYAVPRGGNTATGPSVHLMRELARIFGNIHYGLAELDRDPVGPDRDRGRSEMVAFAWDLEANVRNSSTFIIEHARDRSAWQDRAASVDPLTTLQAVYENNANLGARRVRTAIRAVLPVWFVDEAIELCNAALVKGDGKPLAERLDASLAWFDEHLGVRRERIEARLGKPSGRWTAQDLADLGVIGNSIRRNETTAEEAFPVRPVTAEELPAGGPAVGQPAPATVPATAPAAGPAPVAATEPAPAAADDRPPTKARTSAMFAELKKVKLDGDGNRDDRLGFLSAVADRPIITSSQLTAAEVESAIEVAKKVTAETDEEKRHDLLGGLIVHGQKITAAAAGGAQ